MTTRTDFSAEDLTDHNVFDKYAAGRGWYYDNAWGPDWGSCYVGRSFRIRKSEGKEYLADYLRLLRKDRTGEAEVLHLGGHKKPAEVKIWSGTLNSKTVFEVLMATVDAYAHSYEEQLALAGHPTPIAQTRGPR